MSFGQIIRKRRQQLGLSLRYVANKIGTDPAYLSRVEADKVPPSKPTIKRLSPILDFHVDELLILAGKLPEKLKLLGEKEPYKIAYSIRRFAEMVVSEIGTSYGAPLIAHRGKRAIENGFPFEDLSLISEIESWRKEIYRPIYHLHKWWAQRLGSVFRAAILGATAPAGTSIIDLFYQPLLLPGQIIFDPFMGSGTTIGEAIKLGCKAIGGEINPVAYRAVKTALGPLDRTNISKEYIKLRESVGREILKLYRSIDDNGMPCDVLYYFWVKTIPCPCCEHIVDLFPTFVFSRHVYVRKNPIVQLICPECGTVFSGTYNSNKATCSKCRLQFNPHVGWARHTFAFCKNCHNEFPIAKTYRAIGHPPSHRMFAKLILKQDGNKHYCSIDDNDTQAFQLAKEKLHSCKSPVPHVKILQGYNTRQIINYGYQYWHQLFNDRQLLALSTLAKGIQEIPDLNTRNAFSMLFSGVLEFNNMFASFKGEGTGAVRHMFSHHILKPERMPIEANLWGTAKSSGSFSNLYNSRLCRILDYRDAPFEVALEYHGKKKKGKKVFGLSPPMGTEVAENFAEFKNEDRNIYLSFGDSSNTDLPDESVDLIITDPPFFDNVHYSELADFFYVWQEFFFSNEPPDESCTSRNEKEVQDVDNSLFSKKLKRVFDECNRVLRDEGLLIFSYHHSREDGWQALATAVLSAGFSIVQSQPMKSEMSVATPKSRTKEPIDLDVLLVCRKTLWDRRDRKDKEDAFQISIKNTASKISRFNNVGRKLSRKDVLVILFSELLVELSPGRKALAVNSAINTLSNEISCSVDSLHSEQNTILDYYERYRNNQIALWEL